MSLKKKTFKYVGYMLQASEVHKVVTRFLFFIFHIKATEKKGKTTFCKSVKKNKNKKVKR